MLDETIKSGDIAWLDVVDGTLAVRCKASQNESAAGDTELNKVQLTSDTEPDKDQVAEDQMTTE